MRPVYKSRLDRRPPPHPEAQKAEPEEECGRGFRGNDEIARNSIDRVRGVFKAAASPADTREESEAPT